MAQPLPTELLPWPRSSSSLPLPHGASTSQVPLPPPSASQAGPKSRCSSTSGTSSSSPFHGRLLLRPAGCRRALQLRRLPHLSLRQHQGCCPPPLVRTGSQKHLPLAPPSSSSSKPAPSPAPGATTPLQLRSPASSSPLAEAPPWTGGLQLQLQRRPSAPPCRPSLHLLGARHLFDEMTNRAAVTRHLSICAQAATLAPTMCSGVCPKESPPPALPPHPA
ncbi:hypothetical protein BS78_K023700 [Paspalum vaginatum]|uniref:Uncharacterized protein n=1 Tax=Paspalum vaginatum TaxID=158149 RepID=A0A9W8CCF6_9POAL|nr:hypothetical protein BS78_K128700 [Paspalum vaginatum]KAJ1254048.1 hypothetical protein BS78_K128700 [Paspalum vaginatum]KAJ1254049.1 hypothetical protein BS78_K128700 [Paspalum vaginatum]KAJ1256449.1 hypothetical protein BS78_K023700 [Paspalum vaginatum]KAJ1256450.1 hypothetical protein BS78_K023700 [Paspalum vaginatum]